MHINRYLSTSILFYLQSKRTKKNMKRKIWHCILYMTDHIKNKISNNNDSLESK